MAAGRTNEKGPISPYWWLLLLLLFPLIGWALGQMPVARQEQTGNRAKYPTTRQRQRSEHPDLRLFGRRIREVPCPHRTFAAPLPPA